MNGVTMNTAGLSDLRKASAPTSSYSEDRTTKLSLLFVHRLFRNTRHRTCSHQGYTGESLVPQLRNERDSLLEGAFH